MLALLLMLAGAQSPEAQARSCWEHQARGWKNYPDACVRFLDEWQKQIDMTKPRPRSHPGMHLSVENSLSVEGKPSYDKVVWKCPESSGCGTGKVSEVILYQNARTKAWAKVYVWFRSWRNGQPAGSGTTSTQARGRCTTPRSGPSGMFTTGGRSSVATSSTLRHPGRR